MEPITHLLTGACMGRAGLNRKTALATATLTLGAEAPDIDVLGRFRGVVFGFAHHRGFTHSFLGVPLVAALVIAVIYAVWRLRGRRIKDPNLPPHWGVLYIYACLAGLSHILLDFTNSYGVRPLWPFSGKWYAWDIVSILDPVLLGLLLAGLMLPSFFALINEEIGARNKGLKGRLAATLALIGVVIVWGTRDFEHRRAVAALRSRLYEGSGPIRASAFPSWVNPFRWTGVLETRNFFAVMPVDSWIPDVDPGDDMQIRYKPEDMPVTLAAKNSYLGRVYLDWARYPITETEELLPPREGYIVRFYDLRYDSTGGSGPLSAGVELDRSLKVVAEFFGARRKAQGSKGKQPTTRELGDLTPSVWRATIVVSDEVTMLAYLFVLLAIAVRFLPHPWAFTPVAGSLLFFGARGSRRQMWVPVILLAASDVYLTTVRYAYPFSWDHYVTWVWYGAILWLGTSLHDNARPLRVIGAALTSSVSFFLVSNFAVWAAWTDMYPRTLHGLMMSYVVGLPYFRRGLEGDLLFTCVMFANPVLLRYLSGVMDKSANDHISAA